MIWWHCSDLRPASPLPLGLQPALEPVAASGAQISLAACATYGKIHCRLNCTWLFCFWLPIAISRSQNAPSLPPLSSSLPLSVGLAITWSLDLWHCHFLPVGFSASTLRLPCCYCNIIARCPQTNVVSAVNELTASRSIYSGYSIRHLLCVRYVLCAIYFNVHSWNCLIYCVFLLF